MDAKPQRPRAAWRVRDENLPPVSGVPAKSIHQRNKSTPALSSLLQLGTNRGASKRTVFADVSNTAGARQAQQPAKDDLNLPSKPTQDYIYPTKTSLASVKENSITESFSKATAFLRPAQRPLSMVAQKFNNNVSSANNTISTQPAKVPVKPENTSYDVKPAQELVIKKDAVSKDVRDEVLPSAAVLHIRNDPSLVPAVPTSNNPPVAHQAKQIVSLSTTSATEVSHLSKLPITDALIKAATANALTEAAAPEIVTDLQLEQISLSSVSNQTALELPQDSYIDQQAGHLAQDILPEHLDNLLAFHEAAPELEGLRDDKYNHQSFNLPLGEVEEYWTEDEEEEFYDVDGYTTARSIRSRGDTTGGVTIFMEPRVTAKVERELVAARLFVEATKTPEDVEDEAWDTSMVAEYGDEIFDYMRELENRMKPNPRYMDNQTEIQWSMRAVLMDWVVQVHNRFTLLPETLFLAVNYIDRFLSCKVVSLGKLQLVGATAIFLAAKYEEINCPSVQEIIYMVDGGYSMEEILKAERFMLSMLQFELGWPGPMSFLRRVSKADDYDLETRTLAKYFLEVTVMDERFVASAPSFVAAGAHCLARLMLKKGDWSLAHVHYSGYTYSQLRHLVQTILECCHDPRKHHAAVYDKYSDKRYKRCSLFVETEIQSGFKLPLPARESYSHSQSWRRK